MRVRLSRVEGGAALRTSEVEGEATFPPVVGEPFVLIGKGLEFGVRLVETSPVVSIGGEGLFTTESGSVYRVELLDVEKVSIELKKRIVNKRRNAKHGK